MLMLKFPDLQIPVDVAAEAAAVFAFGQSEGDVAHSYQRNPGGNYLQGKNCCSEQFLGQNEWPSQMSFVRKLPVGYSVGHVCKLSYILNGPEMLKWDEMRNLNYNWNTC